MLHPQKWKHIYLINTSRGKVVKINGRHKRVGKLSDRTIRKFKLEGVKTEEYDFLTQEVNDKETETYTGKIN